MTRIYENIEIFNTYEIYIELAFTDVCSSDDIFRSILNDIRGEIKFAAIITQKTFFSFSSLRHCRE